MKSIKKGITECMTHFEADSTGKVSATFLFPEDFIGFQGHFPGNKILPGVCQIQCAINMLEHWKKNQVTLKKVVMAKFLAPLVPSEELSCSFQVNGATDDDFIIRAQFSKESGRVADIKLKVCFKR